MYEVAGAALQSIRHVAESEWKGTDRRVVDNEELDRTAAVLNEQLVREMFALWRPRYKIHRVKAHAGTPLYKAVSPPRWTLSLSCWMQTWCTRRCQLLVHTSTGASRWAASTPSWSVAARGPQ